MKSIFRLALYLLSGLFMLSCSSSRMAQPQSEIKPLSESNGMREGSIVYGLPRTVFTFTVEFERTIEKPGPYARYAGELLGLDKVITAESESWTVQGISVSAAEELDPSEFYIIESNSIFRSNVLSLKKEGLILDLNPELLSSTGNVRIANDQNINQLKNLDLGSDEYYQIQNDTAYKRLSIDSSFVRVPYVVEKKRRLPMDQLAEKAAKRLMEMREGKHMILTGEANVFPQSDAAILEINRLEKEYMELFTGKTIQQKVICTYHIIPGKDNGNKPLTLFQFSDQTGPVNGNGKSGTPVVLEIIPEQKTRDLVFIKKPQPEKEVTYDKLYYRVPDMVNLKVSMAGEVFLNTRKLVYQFGEVVQLPGNYVIGN